MNLFRAIGVAVVALGTALVSALAVGVSTALATTVPPGAPLWQGEAPGGTLSTVLAFVMWGAVMVAAAVYGYAAVRRHGVTAEVAGVVPIGVAPAEGATERERKAA